MKIFLRFKVHLQSNIYKFWFDDIQENCTYKIENMSEREEKEIRDLEDS